LSTFEVPGTQFTRAQGINDAGQISGWFRAANGTDHGFVKDGDTYTIFDVPSQTFEVFGMNTDGQLVGYFQEAPTGRLRGFLKDGDTFTTLAVPGSSTTFAYGINEGGQIVGFFENATGPHGFLATPVVVDKTPPVITVSSNPATLSPPNGRLVPVTVSGAITDEAGGSGVSSAAYQVTDEYGQVQPSGRVTPEADGSYAVTVALQASRRGNDPDGRHYTITVSATDAAGNQGRASATVTVPRNQGQSAWGPMAASHARKTPPSRPQERRSHPSPTGSPSPLAIGPRRNDQMVIGRLEHPIGQTPFTIDPVHHPSLGTLPRTKTRDPITHIVELLGQWREIIPQARPIFLLIG